MNRKTTVIGATAMQDDGFTELTAEETMSEFADKSEVIADGVTAFTLVCGYCDSDVIAINQLPQMFMLNICYGNGEIFSSLEVCSNCVFDIFSRSKNQPMNLRIEASE
jgi:hypothetical protein